MKINHNTDKIPEEESKENSTLSISLLAATALGISIGVATHQLALGIALGLSIGVAIGTIKKKSTDLDKSDRN